MPDISCENSPASVNGIITVDWRYPHTGGLNLTSVVVDYATPDSGFQEITPQNISQQTTLAVPGFIAGIFYTFRITATNDIGSSSASCPPVFHSTGEYHNTYIQYHTFFRFPFTNSDIIGQGMFCYVCLYLLYV